MFTAVCLVAGTATIHVQLVYDGPTHAHHYTGQCHLDRGRERRKVRTGNNSFVVEDHAFLTPCAAPIPRRVLRLRRTCAVVLGDYVLRNSHGLPPCRKAGINHQLDDRFCNFVGGCAAV